MNGVAISLFCCGCITAWCSAPLIVLVYDLVQCYISLAWWKLIKARNYVCLGRKLEVIGPSKVQNARAKL